MGIKLSAIFRPVYISLSPSAVVCKHALLVLDFLVLAQSKIRGLLYSSSGPFGPFSLVPG